MDVVSRIIVTVLLVYLNHAHSICCAVSYKSACGDLFLGKCLLVFLCYCKSLLSLGGEDTSSDLGGHGPKMPPSMAPGLHSFNVKARPNPIECGVS